jgi:hypothetical protein
MKARKFSLSIISACTLHFTVPNLAKLLGAQIHYYTLMEKLQMTKKLWVDVSAIEFLPGGWLCGLAATFFTAAAAR